MMRKFNRRLPALACALVAAAVSGSDVALAREENQTRVLIEEDLRRPTEPGLRVDGYLNAEYNAHFVSYGRDVWNGGSDWGDSAIGTFNPSAQILVKSKLVDGYAGIWMDVNKNSDFPEAGSNIQEIDTWLGLSFRPGRFTIAATYLQYRFRDQSENVYNAWLSYSDRGQLFDKFGLNPSLLVHFRRDGDFRPDGSAMVLGLSPWFTLTKRSSFPISLTIPVRFGFLEKGYHGGDGGFGYASIESLFVFSMNKNPAASFRWNINAGLTYYMTDKDVIPTNPDANFLTGSLGLSLNF